MPQHALFEEDLKNAPRLLEKKIVEVIQSKGGWISFAEYMQMALYEPSLGYYMKNSQQLGPLGDFVTAPELGRSFAKVLAHQIAKLLPNCAYTVYEFGAGNGTLAFDLLDELDGMGVTLKAYVIVEISPALIARQRETLKNYIDEGNIDITWICELPKKMEGVILGNEFLDAMPCEIVCWRQDKIFQRGVCWIDQHFRLADRLITDGLLYELAQAICPGADYISEINLLQRAFLSDLGKRLWRGAIFLIDYGFPQREYYSPERFLGTLIGHYQHRVIQDPFFKPGVVDLTAHVDFTAIAKTAIDAGLTLVGYTTQADFLINGGILEDLINQEFAQGSVGYIKAVANAQKLLSVSEMGDLFKVIAFCRALPTDWDCFKRSDQSHLL